MRPPGPSPLDLEASLQQQRLGQLRNVVEPSEQPRLTQEALRFWLDAAVEPYPLSRVEPSQRGAVHGLYRYGLLTEDGEVPDDVRPAVETLRAPLCTIDVEATVGRRPGQLRAWCGASCSVLYFTDPPWADVQPTMEAVATHSGSADPLRHLRILPRETPMLAIASWALITPRPVAGQTELKVPSKLFERRLVDHTAELPGDADPRLAEIWGQPLFTWGVRMSPVEESMLILDARSAGHYEVVASDDDLMLHSRTSLQLWDSLLATLESALSGEAQFIPGFSS